MNPGYLTLMRHKISKIGASIRWEYYRILGMKIHRNAILGAIECDWPSKVTIGKECTIEDNVVFKVSHPFSADNYIQIGERVLIGNGCLINCSTRIIIGDDCKIASNTTLVDTGHEFNKDLKINQQPVTSGEIIISEDVWIGTQCVILQGVTIGKGSVIGAGSLVNRSIPAFQVWAGCPARFIKNR